MPPGKRISASRLLGPATVLTGERHPSPRTWFNQHESAAVLAWDGLVALFHQCPHLHGLDSFLFASTHAVGVESAPTFL